MRKQTHIIVKYYLMNRHTHTLTTHTHTHILWMRAKDIVK